MSEKTRSSSQTNLPLSDVAFKDALEYPSDRKLDEANLIDRRKHMIERIRSPARACNKLFVKDLSEGLRRTSENRRKMSEAEKITCDCRSKAISRRVEV